MAPVQGVPARLAVPGATINPADLGSTHPAPRAVGCLGQEGDGRGFSRGKRLVVVSKTPPMTLLSPALMFMLLLLCLFANGAQAADIRLTILQRMTDARVSKENCPDGRWKSGKCVQGTNWKVRRQYAPPPPQLIRPPRWPILYSNVACSVGTPREHSPLLLLP